MAPPAQEDLVTKAAGIAVPPNQGSSSSLLEAVAAPPAQEGPVMRVLVTARRADPSNSPGPASDQAVLSVDGSSLVAGAWMVILEPWGFLGGKG